MNEIVTERSNLFEPSCTAISYSADYDTDGRSIAQCI